MKRFASCLLMLVLLFGSTTVVHADFINYGSVVDPDDPYGVAPLMWETPSLLSYYYYPDQVQRPTQYVYGGAYWGITDTNTFEHSQHAGEDYVSWATYRVNYQLYINDDRDDNTPFKLSRLRLQLNSPISGTEVRVSGYSENINLAVQGVTNSNQTITVDAYPVDTLYIPQNSSIRFSFYIDFTVLFDPSLPVSDIYDLDPLEGPIVPIMDDVGFIPQLSSYVPSQSVGGASAVGQQQLDSSINTGITQDRQQYQDTQNQFQQAVNPGQAGVTSQFDSAADDLHAIEDQVFQNINDYKNDLDFTMDSWLEFQDGLGYVRRIFMIIWNNSPTQVITLSLMLGLAMYLLGRGAVFNDTIASRNTARNTASSSNLKQLPAHKR